MPVTGWSAYTLQLSERAASMVHVGTSVSPWVCLRHGPFTPELLFKPLFKVSGANQAFPGGNPFYAKVSQVNCFCFSPFVTESRSRRCKCLCCRQL